MFGFRKPSPPAAPPDKAALEARIRTALRIVRDPELSVNIYDLGLIYSIRIDAGHEVEIDMTLTAPSCPVAGSLPGQAKRAVEELDDVNGVTVNLVWDPPWTRECISEEARLTLGLL